MTRSKALTLAAKMRLRMYPNAIAQKRTDDPGSAWMVKTTPVTGRSLPLQHAASQKRQHGVGSALAKGATA
jgi:hypothetical protein